MAIQSNSSDIEVAGGIPLYTGIGAMSVIAVNPTLGELNALGIKMKNEPNYKDISFNDDGPTYNKLTFWLSNNEHNFTCRMEILVTPEPRQKSKTGKYQWSNSIGQTAWGEKNPSETYEWFKDSGVRRTYTGEDLLIEFIKAWANIPNGGECSLDTIGEIFKGDVKELTQLVSTLKDNKVRCLLGVKDGKYQQVYTKCFGRLKPKRDDIFVRALNDDYRQFKAEYNEDLELQRYSPNLVSSNESAPKPLEMEEENW
jgi:hypothetical protein